MILSESYLLLFKDETAWKRMGMDAASLPEICVDLTQCRLSWASDPKHAPRGGVHHQDHVVLRLRSQLTGIDLQLHFEDNLNTTTDADIKFITATDEWFECLRPYVKEVAPLSQPNTPRSPPPPLRTVHYDHDLHEQLPKWGKIAFIGLCLHLCLYSGHCRLHQFLAGSNNNSFMINHSSNSHN